MSWLELLSDAALLAAGAIAHGLWVSRRYDSNPNRAPCADLPPATARRLARARRAARLRL